MTRQMLRYEIPVDDKAHDFMLWGDPIRVETTASPNRVEFWAEGDPSEHGAWKHLLLQVFGTGQPLPGGATWIGTTARYAGLVWHLYELPGVPS